MTPPTLAGQPLGPPARGARALASPATGPPTGELASASAVLATGAIAGATAISATADAAPPPEFDRDSDHERDRRNVRFEVQVRHRGHWDTDGTSRDRDDAQRAVRMLERRGQDARIEVERDRR